VNWTEEQKKVIDLRDRNILVSAAAGSGKTAVLVERIISRVFKDGIDIDRMLIVTFTNAAASEMKERINQAIEKKLEESPDNVHLQKQLSIIHHAQITTIHSFCLNVIRNHFNLTDLDPGFRIAQEGELTLLRNDVLKEILEEGYASGEERFIHFVESYAHGKSDREIEELILNLYQFSRSYPWPEEWLRSCKEAFELSETEELEGVSWMKYLLEDLRKRINDLLVQNERAMEICREQDGPYMYLPALESDREILCLLRDTKKYEEWGEVLRNCKFVRLSVKKDLRVDQRKKDTVKQIRDGMKDSLKKIEKGFYFQSPMEMVKDICGCREAVDTLIDYTLLFGQRYKENKLERNIVDFNDLEHYALSVLVDKMNDGEIVKTSVAEELSEYYEEIMIDEYQDSNLVQETLLNAVSREKIGCPNIFMVGDVKQSIYKFRLARPELFMEKFDSYKKSDSKYQRIDLDKNFRSRKEVLASVNFLFYQIMGRELGNIEYDEEAALYTGAEYEPEERTDRRTEIICVDLDEEMLKADEENDYTAKELEAKAVAEKIKEIINGPFMVADKKGGYRQASYRDIVILLRTVSGYADIFSDVLLAEGIPCFTDSRTGYFKTLEVRTVLSLLDIIDNPIQDIPFTAVFRSVIGRATEEELAKIRSCFREGSIYEAVRRYTEEGEEERLRKKCMDFLSRLADFREKAAYMPIHELLWYILDVTGYYDIVKAMPAGDQREANLNMLVEKAMQFESTSYRGLFQFVRYIENLVKYEIDVNEISLVGENEDIVRIMSIHKSKGLEFPVVFVGGMGKKFNEQDARTSLVLHPKLGIGPDYIDYKKRIKSPTLIKKVIQKQIHLENLGEEIRVLYVALTRAKEKLIITGTIKGMEKKLIKWKEAAGTSGRKLLFEYLSTSSCYFDWIMPVLMRHKDAKKVFLDYGITEIADVLSARELNETLGAGFCIRILSVSDFIQNEFASAMANEISKKEILEMDFSNLDKERYENEIKRKLEFEYPYKKREAVKGKYTVSELKTETEEESVDLFAETIEEEAVPEFMKEEAKLVPADYGTAVHLVLQNLDCIHEITKKTVENLIERLAEERKISEKEKQMISVNKIYRFTKQNIFQRMRDAAKKNLLFKERQFIFGISASEINEEFPKEEIVTVQGIIDVYFEEEGELVILDYKTDKVDSEEELIRRYEMQLRYYKKALEQMVGKQVKETVFYSFFLEKEINVDKTT
jgi:ATP-dependent helicase/nuclease subunit A